MAALDRAFALEQMDDIAMRIAEHLDLDMARFLDVFFEEETRIAEARFGLAAGQAKAFGELGIVARDAHALAAAARDGLEHDRIFDPPRDGYRRFGVG